MKYRMIFESDIATLKAAKKVLRKLQRLEAKLETTFVKAIDKVDPKWPDKLAAYDRFFAELNSLGIDIDLNSKAISLSRQP